MNNWDNGVCQIIHYSLFIIHYSLFIVHCSLFIVKLFPCYYLLDVVELVERLYGSKVVDVET